MSLIEMFLWGVGGSVAIEFLNAYKECLQVNSFVPPERYRKPFFYFIRIFIAVIAGGLVIAYNVDQPILAANIGASAPLILQTLASGVSSKNN